MSRVQQDIINRKKDLIKNVFNYTGLAVFLIVLNIFFSSNYWWSIYPIGFFIIHILFDFWKIVGMQISEKYAEKERKKLELKQLEDEDKLILEQEELLSKNWKDKDLV